jgi:hypothetical protein
MCVYTTPTYATIKTPVIPDLNNSAKQKECSNKQAPQTTPKDPPNKHQEQQPSTQKSQKKRTGKFQKSS